MFKTNRWIDRLTPFSCHCPAYAYLLSFIYPRHPYSSTSRENLHFKQARASFNSLVLSLNANGRHNEAARVREHRREPNWGDWGVKSRGWRLLKSRQARGSLAESENSVSWEFYERSFWALKLKNASKIYGGRLRGKLTLQMVRKIVI